MVLLEFYEQKTCFTLISHGTGMFCLTYKTFYWSVYADNKCLCLKRIHTEHSIIKVRS